MQRRRRTKDKHVSYSILPVANLNASTDAEQAPLNVRNSSLSLPCTFPQPLDIAAQVSPSMDNYNKMCYK